MEDDSSERILKQATYWSLRRGTGEVEDDSSERILKHVGAGLAASVAAEVEDDSSERILKPGLRAMIHEYLPKWKTILQREY